ncbi:MAG: type II toxin-antitoxin system HicB family antitoxin [Nitrospirae bacterium]|nr:type II toxin-antitoxin system HicB family antitoxin [Nitrospirota bacterium]
MIQTFHFTIRQKNDRFVAECLEVDLYGEGDSSEEAVSDLRDSLFVHFEELRPFLKIYLKPVDSDAAS